MRTAIAFDISPDALEDLLDLPFRHVPDADRLAEKVAFGSVEVFQDRAHQSSNHEHRWTLARGKVKFTFFAEFPAVVLTGITVES